MMKPLRRWWYRSRRLVSFQRFYWYTYLKSQWVNEFDDVEKFVMFVGYPRSGHSLVGSLLDAHPEMIISHELDALKYVRFGLNKRQIYHLILENSRAYADDSRVQTGYVYDVPGQWQGRYQTLRIIGDKKGGQTSDDIAKNPALFEKLIACIDDVPIKFIHIVRNPFDNIGRITKFNRDRLSDFSIERGLERYFHYCEGAMYVKAQTPSENFFEARSEDIIDAPQAHLRQMCDFLGLDAPQDYLDACASIIFKKPSSSRHVIEWTPEQIASVYQRMADYPYLDGYTFED